MKFARVLFVLIVTVTLLSVSVATATSRFVATTGANAGNCSNILSPCLTLQYAIDQSVANDTINVAAGTYAVAGLISVNKSLSLLGAQSGVDARTRTAVPESILSNTQGISVSASSVVIDGFTIQDSSNAAFTGFGIWLNPGITGSQISNNIFQNNIVGLGVANLGVNQATIQHNLFKDNNLAGANAGMGIYTDEFTGGQVANVLIDENAFENNDNAAIGFSNTDNVNLTNSITITNNTINNCGRGIYFFNTVQASITGNVITNLTAPTDAGTSVGIGLYGNVQNVTISGNDLESGNSYGIRMAELLPGANSNIQIHRNNIFGFATAGLLLTDAPVNSASLATCNWWGSATGPTSVLNPGGTGDAVAGVVLSDFYPWLTSLAPDGECVLLNDDFEDSVLPVQWTYKGPGWTEGTGSLNSGNSIRKSKAIATPVFAGCDNCTVKTEFVYDGVLFPGILPKISVLGWYQDAGNYVELLMKPTTGKMFLKQKVNGLVVAKAKGTVVVAAGNTIPVVIEFDGTDFTVSVNGNVIITMPKGNGSSPTGTVAYYVKATNSHFSYINVVQ